MFDTNIVVCGNVLTAPEWRRISSTGALMAHFRVASTARRVDRGTGRWVDGNNLRLRVTAWRRLAEGIASSIMVGDPVIVYGRLYTRSWKDDNGNNRLSYEVEAHSIGHDLSKGRAKFFRARTGEATSEIEDAESGTFPGSDHSVPLTADEAPIGYGDGVPLRLPDEDEPTFIDVGAGKSSNDAVSGEPNDAVSGEPNDAVSGEPEVPDDELTVEVQRLTEAPADSPRRTRRSTKREPVPA